MKKSKKIASPSRPLTTGERKTYLDLMKNFMISDLQRGINEGLNFLVALGLSTYTKNLGDLCYGNMLSNHTTNYNRFVNRYFDEVCGYEYMKVDKQLEPLGGIYGLVRTVLVHRYLVRGKAFIATYSNVPLRCGIVYTPGAEHEITFVVYEYFKHFKDAFNHYYEDVINKKDPNLIRNFDLAITTAGLV